MLLYEEKKEKLLALSRMCSKTVFSMMILHLSTSTLKSCLYSFSYATQTALVTYLEILTVYLIQLIRHYKLLQTCIQTNFQAFSYVQWPIL